MIGAAFKLCPPRIGYTYFSMLWNGWTTSRRFQGQARCIICGLEGNRDAIEHYPFCPQVRLVATGLFRLPHSSAFATPLDFLRAFFLLDGVDNRDATVTRLLFIQVVYHMQNLSRR